MPAIGPPAPVKSPDKPATLLVLSPGEETAKRIESHMRNAGHPVRTLWITDLEDLEDALRRSPPNVVLCTDGMPKATPQTVIALCNRLVPDLPVLILGANRLSPADTVAALAGGGRDLVAHADLRHLHHLELVCLRELAAYSNSRELRLARARLAEFEARHKKLMHGTADAVVHVKEGIITHANAAFVTLLGFKAADEFLGDPIMDLVAADQQGPLKQFLKLFAQGKARLDSPVPLPLQTREGRVLALQAQAAASHEEGDRLLELLVRPDLTASGSFTVEQTGGAAAAAGGPGRRELYQTAARLAQGKNPGQAALVHIVVDEFPALEERLGFRDIEEALGKLEDLLRLRMGSGDTLFRFGPGELSLLGLRTRVADFEALAEALRKDVTGQLFKTARYEAHMTATVVCYPLSDREPADKSVDNAVRQARTLSRQGGNRCALLGPTAQSAQAEEAERQMADRVRKALQDNRLKLAYQSIASLEGDNRFHYDVLARILDETGKEIPARDFIPVAEKQGLIVAVDRWVIARALKVLAKREGASDHSALFVRLSEQSLQDGDGLRSWLAEQLKARSLRKEEFVVSIREPVIETHVAKARALCKALQALGAEIAVDQFGGTANSEKLLDHVPARFVRFHFDFTHKFDEPAMQKRMAHLMEVAKERKIRTIAGHVEDANVMARLWQMGVNYIQGYHIQEPEAVLLAGDVPR